MTKEIGPGRLWMGDRRSTQLRKRQKRIASTPVDVQQNARTGVASFYLGAGGATAATREQYDVAQGINHHLTAEKS